MSNFYTSYISYIHTFRYGQHVTFESKGHKEYCGNSSFCWPIGQVSQDPRNRYVFSLEGFLKAAKSNASKCFPNTLHQLDHNQSRAVKAMYKEKQGA